ncbi:(5-formylfuran-3-yl)methyl phosphate transaminase [uncultured archaeon]|nr:(5-formylfuran-3-yl)methyl phosphate transaminase [uncultured archaeon]
MSVGEFLKPWIPHLTPYKAGVTLPGLVKLASNENNWGPSPKVVEALKGAAVDVYRYPYKDEEVRSAVAKYAGVSVDNVVLGNGSDELIDLILKAFRGPALSFNPSFSEYRIISQTLGTEFWEVDLLPDFSLPVENFGKIGGKANIIFVATPNNPTGGVVSQKDLVSILKLGKITVVDEAYFEFCGETIVPLIKKHPNLIVLRTLSKAFGLAGLRIGYAVSNPEIIACLMAAKPPFNINYLAAEAALAALADIPYMKKTTGAIIRDRPRLMRGLSECFTAYPSEANFVFADVSPLTAEEAYRFFVGKGFVVRSFGRFPNFGGEYIRVTVGTTDETSGFLKVLDGLRRSRKQRQH